MSAATSTTTAAAGSARRSPVRGWVLLGLGLLAGAGLLTWANLARAGSLEALHPENPREEGARALAQVLEQQGVEVEVVTGDAELREADTGPGTLLVVTSTGELGTATYPALRTAMSQVAGSVLVAPTALALEGLGLPVRVGTPAGGRLEAGCDLAAVRDLTLDATGPTYEVEGDPVGQDQDTCFTSGSGAELPGLLLRLGDVHLLGGASAMSNDLVDEADNAAVMLRLLGSQERVLWYVADDEDLAVTDTRADSQALGELVPAWLVPGLVLLGGALLATMLWQGRRFGPLVVEPLPVTVRADETETSRGRLYRAARDRQHAADALRADARARWRAHLGASPSTGDDELVDLVLRHLSATRPDRRFTRDELRALVHDGRVTDDRGLTRLAAGLAALDPARETRTTDREDPR